MISGHIWSRTKVLSTVSRSRPNLAVQSVWCRLRQRLPVYQESLSFTMMLCSAGLSPDAGFHRLRCRDFPSHRDFHGKASGDVCTIKDLCMPDLTGFNLLERRHAQGDVPPVIVATAFANAAHRERPVGCVSRRLSPNPSTIRPWRMPSAGPSTGNDALCRSRPSARAAAEALDTTLERRKA
jgi:hypothetical protein